MGVMLVSSVFPFGVDLEHLFWCSAMPECCFDFPKMADCGQVRVDRHIAPPWLLVLVSCWHFDNTGLVVISQVD